MEKGGKEEILTVLGGKYDFWKSGGGAKISIILIIYTPGSQRGKSAEILTYFQKKIKKACRGYMKR